jgi:hypothetical protein
MNHKIITQTELIMDDLHTSVWKAMRGGGRK